MKKILTLVALAVGFSLGANAQMRSCDLKVVLASPLMPDASTPYTLNCNSTDSFTEQYYVINQGPDNVLPVDTILLGSPVTTGINYYYANTGDTILSGDTLYFSRKIAATQIKWLGADSSGYIVEELRSNLVAGGNYYFFTKAQLSGYAGANATSEDPVDSNDYDATIVKWNCTTGINGLVKNNSTLTVFPNPASNNITVRNEFAATVNASVTVTDIAGRVVKSISLGKQNAGTRSFNIDIADLNNGMYYIQFVAGDTRSISKFTKN